MPQDPIYTLTKHAVVGLVRSLAPQLERDGITINAICPGLTDTPLLGGLRRQLEETGFPTVGRWNARSFAAHTSLSLRTQFGPLDIWPRPDGTDGYHDLLEKAVDVDVGGLRAKAVHLDDSIRIKRAIGGTKYLGHLPLLRDLQRQRRKQGLD